MAVVHSEKRVEKIFTDAVKKMGGMAVKFTSPDWMGCRTESYCCLGGRSHSWN